MDLKNLKQTHPDFDRYNKKWDYFNRSYLGGEEYRNGSYLRKYMDEDQSPGNQYDQRLNETALQNHCQVVVDTYRSFLFRNKPNRQLDGLENNPFVQQFMSNIDMENGTIDDYFRLLSNTLSIYGMAVIGVDRPAYQARTAGEELEFDIRSYALLYSPSNVLDWEFQYQVNGAKKLSMIKLLESSTDKFDVIKIWTDEVIQTYTIMKENGKYKAIVKSSDSLNPLGEIPLQFVYSGLEKTPGGNSDISDAADLQKSIYNKLSELTQTIRLASHPSIVAEETTELNSGAGAVITVTEDTQIQPYLLQASGASVDGIINAIQLDIDAIDDSTHLKAVKTTTTNLSGIAMQVSRQNLNNKLSDRAAQLERAERVIWQLFMKWQGIEQPSDFSITYEKTFDIKDKQTEIGIYREVLDLVDSPELEEFIADKIVSFMVDNAAQAAQIKATIKQTPPPAAPTI
jgi:hypothetical protein